MAIIVNVVHVVRSLDLSFAVKVVFDHKSCTWSFVLPPVGTSVARWRHSSRLPDSARAQHSQESVQIRAESKDTIEVQEERRGEKVNRGPALQRFNKVTPLHPRSQVRRQHCNEQIAILQDLELFDCDSISSDGTFPLPSPATPPLDALSPRAAAVSVSHRPSCSAD